MSLMTLSANSLTLCFRLVSGRWKVKKVIIAPIKGVGSGVVYSSEQLTEEEKNALALKALPYGGNWTHFFGAECLKKVNWNDQVVLSLTFVSTQEDDFTRQGTLHSRVLVIPFADYLDAIRGGALAIRQRFQKEFSHLTHFLPDDFSQILDLLSRADLEAVKTHRLTQRQIARIAFDLKHHRRALVTDAYADSKRWIAVEQAILDILQSLPQGEMSQITFTTFALSPQDPSDIVALPQQIIADSVPVYITPIGTHQVARPVMATLGRLVEDILFWILQLFRSV